VKRTIRLVSLSFLVLLAATSLSAQNDKASKKPFNISGMVGADGKTIVSDQGSRIWKIANPDLLASAVGQRVTLKALKSASAVADEIVVSAVRLQEVTSSHLHDAAFRR
jgi:hypothetical protein